MTERGREMLIKGAVWAARIIVGGTFIVSGIAKAIDPWGTVYKISAYLTAWHLDLGEGIPLFGAVALSSVEFLAGAMLLLGCYRKVSVWTASALMAFMLPLSLWIAVANPVSDCGCFGDFILLSNWATFCKNVILGAGCGVLLWRNTRCVSVMHPYLQWIAFVGSMAFVLCVNWIGYFEQPIVDFRPYKTGTRLSDESSAGPDASDMLFIYSKDGKEVAFTADDTLPDEREGWVFVERRYTGGPDIRKARNEGESAGLRLWDEEGEEDLTDDVLTPEGEIFIVVVPDLKSLSMSTAWKLNGLYDLCSAHDVEMFAAVASDADGIEAWRDLSMAEYPIYTAEDTLLKEVVRGNPGVVKMKDGVLEWKCSLTAIDGSRLDGGVVEAVGKMPDLRPGLGEKMWRKAALWYGILMGTLLLANLSLFIRRYSRRVSQARRRKAPQGDCSPSGPSAQE